MGKLAFLFSGQGAQYSGMGASLYHASPSAADVFSQADSLRPNTSHQCFYGTKEELSVTNVTQPCLFCVDLAAAKALKEAGIMPDYVAGFSLGELPALAFAGCLSFADAFHFVCKRGQYMEECAKASQSTMYAVVGLAADRVEELAGGFHRCYSANYNCPGQTVVACQVAEAEDFQSAVKKAGGKALKLAVSGGFHSPFMEEAAQILAREFSDLPFNTSQLPVISNVTALPYDDISLLYRQVNSPLLWEKSIAYLLAQGVDTFVEVGPGKTLCGLVAKITPAARTLNVENQETLSQTVEVLHHAF